MVGIYRRGRIIWALDRGALGRMRSTSQVERGHRGRGRVGLLTKYGIRLISVFSTSKVYVMLMSVIARLNLKLFIFSCLGPSLIIRNNECNSNPTI